MRHARPRSNPRIGGTGPRLVVLCGAGLLVGLAGLGLAAGCGSAEVEDDERPRLEVPRDHADGERPTPVEGGAPDGLRTAHEAAEGVISRALDAVTPDRGLERDYWLGRFGHAMRPGVRDRYLATPPAERFEAFGAYFLDLQRRDDMLEPFRAKLSGDEIEAYWSLEGAGACERWLDERFRPDTDTETRRSAAG